MMVKLTVLKNQLAAAKSRLAFLEEKNEEAKSYNKTKPKYKRKTAGGEITKQKRKVQMLEDFLEKLESVVLSEHAQSLVDNGLVTQWKRKPNFYFVKGLEKVALELNDDGDFEISNEYPAYAIGDIEFVEKLLNK